MDSENLLNQARMAIRPTWWSKSGVLLVSVILAGMVVNAVLATPNVIGGGTAMMVIILLLAVIFKVMIEFFLTRWQRKRDQGRNDKSEV